MRWTALPITDIAVATAIPASAGQKMLRSSAALSDGGSRRARIGRCVAVLAAILLSCGCASTRAKGGEGQVLPAMPETLIGVWHRNDSDGRQACAAYKKFASASEIDEESNALLGGLIITKDLVHAYSEYGEGNFYAIKRVVDLRQSQLGGRRTDRHRYPAE
ncbi:MAG TPA: hypothetical protein VEY92_07495 [Pseudoxanthomonas sp.]|nr:hypothetical protein [Pseudoxanthomonas sp.]